MKRLKSLNIAYLLSIFIGLAVGLLPSCKDNDDAYEPAYVKMTPELKDNQVIELKAEGETYTIEFDTNRSWTADTSEDWIAISPKKAGEGESTITIRVTKNLYAEREGQVRLVFGAIKKVIKIKQKGEGKPFVVPTGDLTLKDFLEKYDTEKTLKEVDAIKEDKKLVVTVISDNTADNFDPPFIAYVQDASGKGIKIALPKGGTVKKVAAGDVLEINIKDAKYGYYEKKGYKGAKQLQVQEDAIKKLANKLAEPKVITLADVYTGKYTNTLVTVKDIQFQKAEGIFNDSSLPYFRVEDCKTKAPEGNADLSVNVLVGSKASKLATETIPTKRGMITGILTTSQQEGKPRYWNLVVRTMADFNMTEERCNGGSTEPTGKATLTIPSVEHASVKFMQGGAEVSEVEAGSEVEVVVTPEAGYELKGLKANGEDILATKTFTAKKGENTLEVNVQAEGTNPPAVGGVVFLETFGTPEKVGEKWPNINDYQGYDVKTNTYTDPFFNTYVKATVRKTGKMSGHVWLAGKTKYDSHTALKISGFQTGTGLKLSFKLADNSGNLTANALKLTTDKGEVVMPTDQLKKNEFQEFTVTLPDNAQYIQFEANNLADGVRIDDVKLVADATTGGGTSPQPTEKATLKLSSAVEHASVKFMQGGTEVSEVEVGSEVTVEVTPEANYELKALKANGEDILATKTFTAKKGENTLEVTIEQKIVTPPSGAEHPIILTYVEGKSQEKYIQIYNPTDKDIDLSAYTFVAMAFKGHGATPKNGRENKKALSGTLPSKASIIIKNKKANGYSGVITTVEGGWAASFNGNDPVALLKGETVIDAVGSYPAIWLNGNEGAGIDTILRRKASVKVPNATYDASEWDVVSIDEDINSVLVNP